MFSLEKAVNVQESLPMSSQYLTTALKNVFCFNTSTLGYSSSQRHQYKPSIDIIQIFHTEQLSVTIVTLQITQEATDTFFIFLVKPLPDSRIAVRAKPRLAQVHFGIRDSAGKNTHITDVFEASI